MSVGAFITGTGTGAGKTFVTRGIARAMVRRGSRAFAIKPIETGAVPDPLDALALAQACSRIELARLPEFYRAAPPLAPYAALLQHRIAAPDLRRILGRIQQLRLEADSVWIEGAGGLLVPLDATTDMADFARQLGLPVLLVAANQLGVLSHARTAAEAALRRGLDLAALVLVTHRTDDNDPSVDTNRIILEQRLHCPVLSFPTCADDDDALADAAEACGLISLL